MIDVHVEFFKSFMNHIKFNSSHFARTFYISNDILKCQNIRVLFIVLINVKLVIGDLNEDTSCNFVLLNPECDLVDFCFGFKRRIEKL